MPCCTQSDQENGKPIVEDGSNLPGEERKKNVSDEELKKLSAFRDFINTLDLEDFNKHKS